MRASSKSYPDGAPKRARQLALTGLVARIHLIDDEYTALPAHEPVGAVTPEKGPERILDLHGGNARERVLGTTRAPRHPLEISAGP
jgi:hypothetical protein